MPKIEDGDKIYLGIDPGKSGGLAMIRVGAGPREVMLEPMTENAQGVLEWLGEIDMTEDSFAVLERVHAMPGQGVTSMFTFGRGYGRLECALAAASIPYEEIDPRKWQKGLGIPPRKKDENQREFKKRLMSFAVKLFPGVSGITVKTADALLIAEFCRRYREGKL